MKFKSLAFAGLLLSAVSITPASADYANVAMVYLGPELPNYLTPHGPARCTWADLCWYRLQLGMDLDGGVVTPVMAAPVAGPRVRAKR